MRECITIHVGEAGVEMGNASWELLCLEHGVRPDGMLSARNKDSRYSIATTRGVGCNPRNTKRNFSGGSSSRQSSSSSIASSKSRSYSSYHSLKGISTCPADTHLEAFFEAVEKGKTRPRALMVDTDCSAINNILTGAFRQLHHPSNLIRNRENTGGVFSGGYFNSAELLNKSRDKISNMAESCENLGCIIVFRSCGGGTGSGLGSALMLQLADDFGNNKKTILEVDTGPARKTNCLINASVVEPYNTILATHTSMNLSECALLVDNNRMYEICENQLKTAYPQYHHLNRIVSQVVSAVTASARYKEGTSIHLTDLPSHVITYPRLKYPMVSLAPLMKTNPAEPRGATDVTTITKKCFQPSNHLIEFDPRVGNYMECALLCRGDVDVKSVDEAIVSVKELKRFYHRNDPNICVGITSQPAPLVPFSNIGQWPRSAVLLSNTTAIKEYWKKIVHNFVLMFEKRAFTHWYLKDGMEMDELREAMGDVVELVRQYDEVDASVAGKFEKKSGNV